MIRKQNMFIDQPSWQIGPVVQALVGWLFAVIIIGLVMLVIVLASQAHARDRGQYATLDPQMKDWFNKLSSKKGPCCADADGNVVTDADWESRDGHYRVRLNGNWIDVPDDAVVKTPNLYGPTMVWPFPGQMGLSIRCFMPGSMT